GFGVQGTIGAHRYTVASPRYFLASQGPRPEASVSDAAAPRRPGGVLTSEQLDAMATRHPGASLAIVTRSDEAEHRFMGLLALRDEPREDAAQTLQLLRRLGVQQLVMLTG